MSNVECPCGQGEYKQCCQPLHLGQSRAQSAACILIDIVISYHYTQIVEFGVLLKS